MKKKISSNYGILVIILFATVCFLTDYIYIGRKLNEGKNSVIETNTDCVNSVCNCDNDSVLSYSYNDIFGVYYAELKYDDVTSDVTLTLFDDYTFTYEHSFPSGHTVYGNYIIDDDTIVLNYLYSKGIGDASLNSINNYKNIIKIESTDKLVDTIENLYPGITEINLIRKNDDSVTMSTFDYVNSYLMSNGFDQMSINFDYSE